MFSGIIALCVLSPMVQDLTECVCRQRRCSQTFLTLCQQVGAQCRPMEQSLRKGEFNLLLICLAFNLFILRNLITFAKSSNSILRETRHVRLTLTRRTQTNKYSRKLVDFFCLIQPPEGPGYPMPVKCARKNSNPKFGITLLDHY